MPPQRSRDRDYNNSVDPDAIHAEPEKLTGFGEKRTVIKDIELDELREKAHLAEQLKEQLAAQSNGLTVQEGGLVVQGFQFSPTGLIPPDEITQESWEQVGLLLFRLEGSMQWLIGDWLAYGEDLQYGQVKQIADSLGKDYKTLRNCMTVSRAIEVSRRRDTLSYGHHEAVTKYEPDEQAQYLAYAQHQGLNRAQFRKWLKEEIDGNLTPELPSSDVPKFDVIARDLQKFMQTDPETLKPKQLQVLQTEIQNRLHELDRLAATIRQRFYLD